MTVVGDYTAKGKKRNRQPKNKLILKKVKHLRNSKIIRTFATQLENNIIHL